MSFIKVVETSALSYGTDLLLGSLRSERKTVKNHYISCSCFHLVNILNFIRRQSDINEVQ